MSARAGGSEGLKLTCGLVVGTRVRYRGREWTVMGGPVGDNQLPEVQDFVYLERDRTEAGFLSVGVHLAAGEVELLEDR